MAYNVTTREQNQAAIRDTKEKLRREAIISAALISGYFKPISKLFFNEYKRTGQIPNLAEHHANLNDILNKQYSNTSKKFIRQIRNALGKPENSQAINEAVNFNRDLLQSVDVFVSGNSIAATTENNLQNAVNKILEEARQQEITLSNLQVAKLAKRKFDSLTKGRVDTISETETQGAAEKSKSVEARTLISQGAIFTAAGILMAKAIVKKRWVTMRDNRVRPAHVQADNQIRNVKEPFLVGGEQLMEPRDTSLGASLRNVINCRCASIISIR